MLSKICVNVPGIIKKIENAPDYIEAITLRQMKIIEQDRVRKAKNEKEEAQHLKEATERSKA